MMTLCKQSGGNTSRLSVVNISASTGEMSECHITTPREEGVRSPVPPPAPPPGQADCCPSGAAHITPPLSTALHPKIGAPYPLSGPCASRYHSPRHSEVTVLVVRLPQQTGRGVQGTPGRSTWALHPPPSIHSFIHSSRFHS